MDMMRINAQALLEFEMVGPDAETARDVAVSRLTKDDLWYLRDRFEHVYTALAAEYETRD